MMDNLLLIMSSSFYDDRREIYVERSLANKRLTDKDREFIKKYIASLKARKRVSQQYAESLQMRFSIWREWLPKPYNKLTKDDIETGLATFYNAKNKNGNPYTRNTQYGYVKDLKGFLKYLAKEKIIKVDPTWIHDEIKLPKQDFKTETSKDLLTVLEVEQIIKAAKNSRDRAFISTLYESGARVAEVCRLKWGDLSFEKYSVHVEIDDRKEMEKRETWLTLARPYLAQWRNDHPDGQNPNAPVFVTIGGGPVGEPISYFSCMRIITETANKAGIDKRVHLHLFRKSRGTHMVAQNYNPEIVKKTLWNNTNTKMFDTYLQLGGRDIEREMKSKAGIPMDDQSEPNKIEQVTTRPCPKCHEINGPDRNFCGICGTPLTDAVIREKSQWDSKIDSSDEMKSVLSRLDAMSKELERLKSATR